MNDAIHYGLIENAIASLKLKNLKSMTLIDTFSGKGIPQDSISMTIRFVYQSNTRSLLDLDDGKLHLGGSGSNASAGYAFFEMFALVIRQLSGIIFCKY